MKVKPYVKREEAQERLKLRIKISNAPYTIVEDDVRTLLKPFVEIDEIVLLYYQYVSRTLAGTT